MTADPVSLLRQHLGYPGFRPGQEDLVHDNRFYEAGGLFNAVNKGKRDCVVSLAEPEGRDE